MSPYEKLQEEGEQCVYLYSHVPIHIVDNYLSSDSIIADYNIDNPEVNESEKKSASDPNQYRSSSLRKGIPSFDENSIDQTPESSTSASLFIHSLSNPMNSSAFDLLSTNNTYSVSQISLNHYSAGDIQVSDIFSKQDSFMYTVNSKTSLKDIYNSLIGSRMSNRNLFAQSNHSILHINSIMNPTIGYDGSADFFREFYASYTNNGNMGKFTGVLTKNGMNKTEVATTYRIETCEGNNIHVLNITWHNMVQVCFLFLVMTII